MKISKLVSTNLGILLSIFLVSTAYAEYYDPCDTTIVQPTPEYVETVSRPPCYRPCYRPCHRIHHRCRRHRPNCCPRRSTCCYPRRPMCCPRRSCADLSIYYVWNSYPSACTCSPCDTCANYSACGNSSSIYYVPASRAYMLDEYDYMGFDFDRRTADDIGNDLDIDY